MRPKKSPIHKVPIWAVDCETDPFEYGRVPEPFLWGVYEGYGGNYWEFERIPDLMAFLSEQNIIAYAHNGGKFDWHFITAFLDPSKSLLVINGRLSRFEIGKCEFRDSYNLMPISLDQYQKTEIEYWKFERPVRHLHMAEIRTYLKSDCVNLWNMLNGFETEFGRHLTQASAAMKIWQKRAKRRAPSSGPAFYDMIHPYYYGGRVQCFESGDFELDAKSIDRRSAYPAAMLSEHPISLEYSSNTGAPDISEKRWGPCMFKVRAIARGAFPYRGINKMLYFPADDITRTYTVTGWELLAALETGTVENLDFISWYQFYDHIDFKDYVLYFWEERKKAQALGDKGRNHYCKIFLNGLYGKFASDPREYKQYEIMPRDRLAEIVDSDRDFDFFREWLLVSETIKREQYRFYNLATAASITGLVRADLWRVIRNAKRPLYCDTDSVTAVDFGGVEIGDELGQWGIEGEYDRLIICGKKMYAFHKSGMPWEDSLDRRAKVKNWKKATKGASLTAQNLMEIAAGRPSTFLPMVPTFSVHKSDPRFTARIIKMTAADVSTVPQKFDPEFVKSADLDRENAA